MPLITSCPECSTQFVVTKEQLKAYEGKVRCGTCNHVFNAKEFLVKSAKQKKPAQTKLSSVLNEVSLNEDTINEETSEYIEITSPDNIKDAFRDEPKFDPSVVSTNIFKDEPSVVNDLSIDERLIKKPKKTPFNWSLFALSTLLLLTLFTQSAYFLRSEISAYYPQTKTWFNLACEKIGCKIELSKKIDLLTIDDSDMQEHLEYENVLQFSSTLINHANIAQAYPTIELTLTNIDDQAVLRRSFTAKDYLPQATNIENGIAAKEEIRIKLNLNTSDIAVAGYRASLNY